MLSHYPRHSDRTGVGAAYPSSIYQGLLIRVLRCSSCGSGRHDGWPARASLHLNFYFGIRGFLGRERVTELVDFGTIVVLGVAPVLGRREARHAINFAMDMRSRRDRGRRTPGEKRGRTPSFQNGSAGWALFLCSVGFEK